MEKEYSSAEIEKAKKIVGGSLGEVMAKFPLQFCLPIFFGNKPKRDQPIKVNNGTVTLLKFKDKFLAFTSKHVIDEYKDRAATQENIVLQIGDSDLKDPLNKIFSEGKESDLISLKLDEAIIEKILGNKKIPIGNSFWTPPKWPPTQPIAGNYVAIGGFPGEFREYPNWREIGFGSFSLGATEVSSVHKSKFISKIEKEYWVNNFNYDGREDIINWGGLSGGPAFLIKNEKLITNYEFIGFITEFSHEFGLLYVTHANCMDENGRIS